MLIQDLGDALIPLTEGILDDVGEWLANHAHGSLTGCRGHLANQRDRVGGKEKEALVSEMRWQRMVRAMMGGGAPYQPTHNHHPITDRHQSGHVSGLLFEVFTKEKARAQISQSNLLAW